MGAMDVYGNVLWASIEVFMGFEMSMGIYRSLRMFMDVYECL